MAVLPVLNNIQVYRITFDLKFIDGYFSCYAGSAAQHCQWTQTYEYHTVMNEVQINRFSVGIGCHVDLTFAIY